MTITAPWTCEWCLHEPCACDEIAAWHVDQLTSHLQPPSSSPSVVVDAQEEEEEEEADHDEYEGRCPWCHSAPCHCEETAALRQRGCEAPCSCVDQDVWNLDHMWIDPQPSTVTVNVPCEESEVFEERVRRHEARVQAYEIRLAAYEADVRALDTLALALEALREPPTPTPTPTRTYK